MIVTDLDGTLLNSEGKVAQESREYLKKLKEKGFIIVIATGRIYARALYGIENTDFVNYIISDTGSCISSDNGITLFKNIINKDSVKKILDYYNEDLYYIDVCDKTTIYSYTDGYITNNNLVKMIKDKQYIIDNCKDVFHMTILPKNNKSLDEIYSKIVKNILDVDVIKMQNSFASTKWLEIIPKRCSKSNAIKKLANYLNISYNEIIPFGDGLNDIEMLEKFDKSVAMKNALPEVKKVANAITINDHNHNGVVNYLKSYLKID